MIALQQHVASLKGQLLQKDTSTSPRGSCDGRPYTPGGVKKHVESIVTPQMGRQVKVYLCLSNVLTLSNLLMIWNFFLQEKVFFCTQAGDRVVVGLTQP